MEQFKEIVDTFWGWLNQPLPIIGVSTIFVLIFLWKIFSSTSFGKKQIKKINEGFKRLETSVDEKAKEIENTKKEVESYIEESKKDYDFLLSVVIELCETLPNKKIKSIVEKVKEHEERKNG